MKSEIVESLKKQGWESIELKAKDRREIYELQSTVELGELQKTLSKYEVKEDINVASLKNGGGNWTLVEMWKNLDVLNKKDDASFDEALQKLQERAVLETKLPALQSAKKALRSDHPNMFDNMCKVTDYLKLRKTRRKRHMDSLGIFDHQTNAVRTRTIYRVELNRGCSRAKLSDTTQDFRDLDLDWTDTLAGRLERLYRQVLDLVHVHKRRRRRCFIDTGGKMKRFLAIASEKSPRLLEKPESPDESATKRGGAVQMTPQRLAEHYAKIAGAQEMYVYRYRGVVADKRNEILRDIGVDPETPWTVEQVLTKLEQHFKQRCYDEVDEAGSDHGSVHDIGGRKVDTATTTTALVAAALSQIEKAHEAMEEYKGNRQSTPSLLAKKSDLVEHSSVALSGNITQRSSAPSSSLSLELENADTAPVTTVPGTPESDGIRPRRLRNGQHPLERAFIQPPGNKGEEAKSQQDDAPSDGDTMESTLPVRPVPILPSIQLEAPSSERRMEDNLVARLERLWFILQMPMNQKIDMVMKYTSEPNANGFEDALDIWEMAAAAVLHRESILGELVAVRKVLAGNSKGDVNLSLLKDLAGGFLHASERLHEMKDKLQEIGDELEVGGEPYPGPGEIQSEHIDEFIAWVKDVGSGN